MFHDDGFLHREDPSDNWLAAVEVGHAELGCLCPVHGEVVLALSLIATVATAGGVPVAYRCI